MFRYDYIAVVDIDEFIMPLQHKNWNDMIRDIKNKTPEASNNTSTFVFRMVLFLDENAVVGEEAIIPNWLHMMNHVDRSFKHFPPGVNIKAFHSTERQDGALQVPDSDSLLCHKDTAKGTQSPHFTVSFLYGINHLGQQHLGLDL